MPDILKVTTPLVNNNQPVVQKHNVDPLNAFSISNPARVQQAQNEAEILKQNTVLQEGSEAPVLLLNLLKDPAVAISYLKNIFLLEEIFRLLPANNKTVTPEIEQIFERLIMQPEDITAEMSRQQAGSTIFRGEIFDFLRQVSAERRDNPQVQMAVANFLKSVNNLLCKEDIADAIANGLEYLQGNLPEGSGFSQRTARLISLFREADAHDSFPALKEETLALFKDLESSGYAAPKMNKVISIITYNLSRYNSNLEFFSESAYRLRQFLSGDQLREYISLLDNLVADIRSGAFFEKREAEQTAEESKVMDALVQMVHLQSANTDLSAADSSKVDKILESLLSSPCNFTPLLHFIIPVLQDNIQAFAEIWINPQSDEKDMPEGVKEGKHFLLVIDVESIGRFEVELFAYNRTTGVKAVDVKLLCPPEYEKPYTDMMKELSGTFEGLNYRLGKTSVEPLDHSRSLMEVFKSLPFNRVGVYVRV